MARTDTANTVVSAAPQITHTNTAPDAFAPEEGFTADTQTVGPSRRRLRTVATAKATFGERSPAPRPPKSNGNPRYAFGIWGVKNIFFCGQSIKYSLIILSHTQIHYRGAFLTCSYYWRSYAVCAFPSLTAVC